MQHSTKLHRFWIIFFTVIAFGSLLAELGTIVFVKVNITVDSLGPALFLLITAFLCGCIVQIPSLVLGIILWRTYSTAHGHTIFTFVIAALLAITLLYTLIKLPICLPFLLRGTQ